jgi:hypothetical protein
MTSGGLPPVELEDDSPVELEDDPPVELEDDPPVELEEDPLVEPEDDPPVELDDEPPVEPEEDPLVELALEPPAPPSAPASGVGLHVPAWQVPTEHVASSGFAGFEHTPVVVSHRPTSWQSSEAEQTTGVPAAHTPV